MITGNEQITDVFVVNFQEGNPHGIRVLRIFGNTGKDIPRRHVGNPIDRLTLLGVLPASSSNRSSSSLLLFQLPLLPLLQLGRYGLDLGNGNVVALHRECLPARRLAVGEYCTVDTAEGDGIDDIPNHATVYLRRCRILTVHVIKGEGALRAAGAGAGAGINTGGGCLGRRSEQLQLGRGRSTEEGSARGGQFDGTFLHDGARIGQNAPRSALHLRIDLVVVVVVVVAGVVVVG
mmetsp:Transcript_22788/g.49478  ORF Transcript_22788/g.49478 Transcript_22788/m.49478 type:complete len:234 (-) Transcript_22788:173-874(-)